MPRPTHLAVCALLPLVLPMAPQAEEAAVYGTPAFIVDFPDDPEKQARMQTYWNANMAAFTADAIAGNPWANNFDAPRNNYFAQTDAPTDEAPVVQPITWTAFPNKVAWYFSVSQDNPYQLNQALLYPLAEYGRLDPDSAVLKRWIALNDTGDSTAVQDSLDAVLKAFPEFASTNLVDFAPVMVPSDICPVVNWDQSKAGWGKFSEPTPGPRGWKDEYNEWAVKRDKDGNILSISFTAENPEYWFTLWEVDPERVLELYHQLVSDQVVLEDLYLVGSDGKVVHDHNGNPAYNPLNRWNYGNDRHGDMGGAVHLTSPPNTVGAEIYLGAAATILRDIGPGQYSPQNNNCQSQYGESFRNSDPNIGMQANQVVRNLGLMVTLNNPIALYMQKPDFTNYTTPDGTDPSEFFTVVRGKLSSETGQPYDEILHATYEVPADKNYTVSDIKIGGTNILYASQIAETFNQALAAAAYKSKPAVDTRFYPMVTPRQNPNGDAQPMVAAAVLKAVTDNPAISSATIPVLPLTTEAGRTLDSIALTAPGGNVDAAIRFVGPDGSPAPGIHVSAAAPASMDGPPITQNGVSISTTLYTLKIEIDADTAPGSYGVQVTNPGNAPQVPTPGSLIILENRAAGD